MPEFDRKSGIGASLAPAILGLSPWQSALGAYLWYVGLLPDVETTEPMEIGTELEPAIRHLVELRLGVPIPKPETRRHPWISHIYASPDGLVGPRWGFDAKNVGPGSAKHWGPARSDEIPDYVIIQTQQQMLVFDLDKVTVGALVCGCSLRLYEVMRNERLIHFLVGKLAKFWEQVQNKVPPEPDFEHGRSLPLLQALYGLREGEVIDLPAEGLELVHDYQDAAEFAAEDAESKNIAKAKLLYLLQGAQAGRFPDGTIICRKKTMVKAYQVPAFEKELFQIKAPPKKGKVQR